LKRICQSVWQFTNEQLWGPSHMRNQPDLRYPLDDGGYLTPRQALQALDSLRVAEADCWNRLCMTTCKTLLKPNNRFAYEPSRGLLSLPPFADDQLRLGMIITDVRFPREADYIRSHGGMMILIERKIDHLPVGIDVKHPSEIGLLGRPREEFDGVVDNTTLEELPAKALEVLVGLGVIQA
jgi:hypothetical protein